MASENMEEMANNLKEGWREMTVKVAEVLETNTEMVNKNMVEMANNLEEAWGDMVEERFGGDDSIALQVFISPILLHDGHGHGGRGEYGHSGRGWHDYGGYEHDGDGPGGQWTWTFLSPISKSWTFLSHFGLVFHLTFCSRW